MITDDQLLSSPAVRGALARMRGVGLDKIAGVPTLEAAVLDLTTKFAYALLKQARVQSGLQSAAKLAWVTPGQGAAMLVGSSALAGGVGGYSGAMGANPQADRVLPTAAGALGGVAALPVGALAGGALGFLGGRLAHGLGGSSALPIGGALAGGLSGAIYAPPAAGEYIGEKLTGLQDAEVAKIATILGNTFKRAPKATPAAAPAAAAGELPEFIRNFKPAPPPAKAPVERTMSVTSTPKPIQAFDPHELQANAFLARLKPASGTPDGPFTLAGMKGRTVTAALQIPGSIMRGGLAGAGVGAVGGAIGAGEGNRMQGALGGAAVGAGVGAGAGQLARRNFGNAMKGIDAAQGAGTANRMQAAQAFARGQTAQAARGGASWDDATKFMARPEIAAVNQARGQRNLTLAGGTAAAGLGAAGIAAAASPSERR